MTAWPSLRKCVRFNILFFAALLSFLRSDAFSQEMIILNVVLNAETVGVCFLVKDGDDIWIKKEDIEKTDLRADLGKETEFEGEKYISLKSISGVSFQIDESDASLNVSAASHLFESQSISLAFERPYSVIYPKENSAFLNYGILYDDESPLVNVSTEVGVRVSDYLALSTFNYDKTEDESKFVRLLTSVRTDDRENLTTIILGDFTAEGSVLGSSRILGGLSFSKNYSINPYLLRYPSLSINGAVETPSEMEIYVNDQLVGRRKLNPGEFVLSDVPTTVGLSEAKIVIKDIYGRRIEVPNSFYYSDRLVKKGVHEYSYNIGLSREDLGIKDSSYGDMEVIAFHAYGFSNNFKGGFALEAGPDVINAGPAAAFPLPFGGVAEAAFSFTEGEGKSGYGGEFDYVFRSERFLASLSLRELSKEFSSLSIAPSDDKPETQLSMAMGFSGGKSLGSVSMDYSWSKMHLSEDTQRWAVSYNRTLLRDMALFARLSTADTEGETEREAFLGLNIYLDKDLSGEISYTDRDDDGIIKAGIQKNLPTAGGFGFRAEEERHEDYTDRRAELQYQNDYGVYEADYTNLDGEGNYSLQMSGGVGYIDGSGFLSRPIRDSFAKVKVGNLEDVGVSYYGNVVTTTNSKGEAIVPAIQSFNDNKIGIEKDDIPIDYSVPALSLYVNPPYRSGSVVSFEAAKAQGFFGTVYVLLEGKTVPVEYSTMRLTVNGSVTEGLVGRGGEFYFENAPPGTHQARVFYEGRECDFEITIPESDEIMLNLGEMVCKFPDKLPVKESRAGMSERILSGEDNEKVGEVKDELPTKETNGEVSAHLPIEVGRVVTGGKEVTTVDSEAGAEMPGDLRLEAVRGVAVVKGTLLVQETTGVASVYLLSEAMTGSAAVQDALLAKKFNAGILETLPSGIGKEKVGEVNDDFPVKGPNGEVSGHSPLEAGGRTSDESLQEVVKKDADELPCLSALLAQEGGVKVVRRTIYFDLNNDTAQKESTDVMEELSCLMKLKTDPRTRMYGFTGDFTARINGYTDDTGTEEYNELLGMKRAAFVKRYLVDVGVKEKQIIKTVSFGEKNSVCRANTRECRKKNRRVEVILYIK